MIRQELRRYLCIFSCFMAITSPVKTVELTSENALDDELLNINELPPLEVTGGHTQTIDIIETFSNDPFQGTTEAMEEEGSGEVPIETVPLFPTNQHSTTASTSTIIPQLTTSNIPTTPQLTSSYLLTLDPAPDNFLTTTQQTSATTQGQSEDISNDGSHIGEYYVYQRQVSFVENPLRSDIRRDIIHCALSCSSLTSCAFFSFFNRACSLYAGNDTGTTYMSGAVIYKRKIREI